MSEKVLKYLLLCLAVIAGCNKVAFIEEEDRFRISENDIYLPDIGDTRHISLNKEDWIIESVEMTDSIGHHFLGNISENGRILTSTRMQMKGLGEIWTETTYGGFRIIRDEYDALTVRMGPNLTYQERNLKIVLRSGVETIELSCIQQPSQGYVIDRIEWDENVSAIESEMKIERVENLINHTDTEVSVPIYPFQDCRRIVAVWHDRNSGDTTISPDVLMDILRTSSFELKIPSPLPAEGGLVFEGESLEVRRNQVTYYRDLDLGQKEPTVIQAGRGVYIIEIYLNYILYDTCFHVYLKHARHQDMTICHTLKLSSLAPDGINYEIRHFIQEGE